MRKQFFLWSYFVLAVVLTAYGGYSLIYNFDHKKQFSLLGLIFFVVGLGLLILFLVLFIISAYQKRKQKLNNPIIDVKPEEVKEPEAKEEPVSKKAEEVKEAPKVASTPRKEVVYDRSSSSRSFDTIYVKKVGYGPVLRVTGPEVLDMRTNTYYRIEGNVVNQSGYGPVFEISGNRIRSAFGGYLYEISGSSVNKVYGGYYASIGGGYIQVHDLSEKYELDGSLSLKQQLAVVALLFGTY